MTSDGQMNFGAAELASARELTRLALREDLGESGDLTCRALIDPQIEAEVQVVARQPGVISGLPIGALVFAELDPRVVWRPRLKDGDATGQQTVVATVSGPLQSLLTGERTMLNWLTHLSGIASLTRQYVDSIVGTKSQILDTRKTHPAYRLLEKYAVRCGGGKNHRMGLYDGVLIKDNHLAAWTVGRSIAEAVRTARARTPTEFPIEVEVDTLTQLQDALDGVPDIVLLDNMTTTRLVEAVALRNERAPSVQLEASGGITLASVASIAATGVERISVGAITHSAAALDIALDWGSLSSTLGK